MARNSNSSPARELPLGNIYTFTVHVTESHIPLLSSACDMFVVQAHRSLMPVDDNVADPLYSIQLQISCHSVSDALSKIFIFGTYFGTIHPPIQKV